MSTASTVLQDWMQALGPWLESSLPGAGRFVIEPLVAGHSNLVVAASRGDDRCVVRRPPAGQLAAGAHDVLREARVLHQLELAGFNLAPRVLAVAEDGIGGVGPCYAMSRLPGEAVRSEQPAWLDAARARRCSHDVVDALAALHALPVAPFVAARLGRDAGYLERQLALWGNQRDDRVAARRADGKPARELADEREVRAWLTCHRPLRRAVSVVHGDYKLDNALVDPQTGAVTAVLDWEMATVGDPLADLGYLLALWPDAPDEVVLPDLTGSVTCADGFLRTAELAHRYASRTGADLTDLDWYRCLALWKIALLLEASYGRYLDGDADDPYFATLEVGVPSALAAARRLTG